MLVRSCSALALMLIAFSTGTAGAQSSAQGGLLLPTRYDSATGKVFLTIPRGGAEFLYLNTLATGLGTPVAGLDRGEVGLEALVRFERRGPRVLLVRQNTGHTARGGSEALRRSAEESFPRSVLASFAVTSDGADGIVNLAGEPIAAKRWTKAQKERLKSSRIDTARSLVDAIGKARVRPKFMISASAVGYYGSRGDEVLT